MLIDAALVAAAREGDAVASEELLSLTRPYVVRYARLQAGDAATADDIVQDVLVEAWRTLAGLRSPEAYLTWVRLLVTKHADRHRRGRRPLLGLDLLLDVADPSTGPAEIVAGRDQDRIVRRSLELAPDGDRRLLDLRYYEGWSDHDLAALLGIAEGTVRKRLFDARRRLRPALSDLAPQTRSTAMTNDFGTLTHVTDHDPVDRVAVVDETPLATGVRVLDALLPWPRAGLVDLLAPANTGAMVLLGEVLTGLHRQSPAALVGAIGDGANPLGLIISDPDGQPDRSMLFGGDPHAALAAAASEAGRLARTGTAVLLAVDGDVADATGLDALARLPLALAHGSVTVVRVGVWGRDEPPLPAWPEAQTRVVLSRELAALGVYPAVDLLESGSRLADPDLAARARVRLEQARELHRWIAQPFVTAEPYTGVRGERLTTHEAVTQLQAVLM